MEVQITATRPQAQFYQMNCKYPAFVAGFGCVREDTPVVTEFGIMRICDIPPLTRVLSWNATDQKFQLSLTSGSFPKGKANLYRVLTTRGELHVTGHHRLFSSDGTYQQVQDFDVNQTEVGVCNDLPLTSAELDLILSGLDAPNYDQTSVDFLGRYGDEARQYGQQLLMDQDNDRSFSPSPDGVRELYQCYGSYASWRTDDQEEPILKHTRHDQSGDRQRKNRSLCQRTNHVYDEEGRTLKQPPVHISDYLRKGQQSVEKYVSRRNTEQHSFVGHSLKNLLNLDFEQVQGITDSGEEQVYWDICVLDTNNYVTADGTIHHNSGKSEALLNSALLDSLEGGASSLVALYEPTFDLVRLILAPRLEEKLATWGINYRYNQTHKMIYTSSSQVGDFIFRSLDTPERIVGYESFRAKIDELDTLKKEHAKLAWEKIVARNRQKPSTYVQSSNKPLNTVSVFTTPEGFRFVHDRWVLNKTDGYELIQAATASNPYLPDDYIISLINTYPAQLIAAYLEGRFVNLTSGTIYSAFDRKLNHCDEFILPQETVYVGMDFNVGKMSSVIHVLRGNEPCAVGEITGGIDTPDMIRMLKERLWEYNGTDYTKSRRVIVYPDASGNSRKTNDASETDIQLLELADFEVDAPKANPPVKDRINSMNAKFCNANGERTYHVNTYTCPIYTNCLEQQAYDKNGEPDKSSGFDHINDAGGYFIHRDFPIYKKQTFTTRVRGF